MINKLKNIILLIMCLLMTIACVDNDISIDNIENEKEIEQSKFQDIISVKNHYSHNDFYTSHLEYRDKNKKYLILPKIHT